MQRFVNKVNLRLLFSRNLSNCHITKRGLLTMWNTFGEHKGITILLFLLITIQLSFAGSIHSDNTPTILQHQQAAVTTGNITLNSSAGTSTATYSNLKAAFDAINNGTHQGEISIAINAGITETSSATLNSSGSGSANYSSIQVFPTASGLSITGNLATALIDLNGADNVTIDGRVNRTGNTADLTIVNQNNSTTAGTSTIRLINGTQNCKLQYCQIKGAGTAEQSGTIFISGNGTNSGHIISYNKISGADTRAFHSIYSNGTNNSNIQITNNHFVDFFCEQISYGTNTPATAIYAHTGSSGWTISGNNFYETRIFNGGYDWMHIRSYQVIRLENEGGGFNITNNNIGGSEANCAGTAMRKNNNWRNGFAALSISTAATETTDIQGNKISNIDWRNNNEYNNGNSQWIGINIEKGNTNIGTTAPNLFGVSNTILLTNQSNQGADLYVIKIDGNGSHVIKNNQISNLKTNNTEPSFGASIFLISQNTTAESSDLIIENNLIGSIDELKSIEAASNSTSYTQIVAGIYKTGSAGTLTAKNNIIAGLWNAGLQTNSSTVGIFNSAGIATIHYNEIYNISYAGANNAGFANKAAMGICLTGNSNKDVQYNHIYKINNYNTAQLQLEVAGIYISGGTNLLNANFVNSLTFAGTPTWGAQIFGIQLVSGINTLTNNVISLTIDLDIPLYGISDASASGQSTLLYYNTIYLGGYINTQYLNDRHTAAYRKESNSGQADIRNNIFFNNRRTADNYPEYGNKHFAIYFNSAGNISNLNHNSYYAPQRSGYLMFYNSILNNISDIRTATGQDANSTDINPSLRNAGGPRPTDYNTTLSSGMTGTPIAGVTKDHLDIVRSETSPTIGAFESRDIYPVEIWKNSTLQARFVSVKAAFDAINSGTHTGDMIVLIRDNSTETSSAVLNASGSGAASYSSVVLRPAYKGLMISGNVAGPLIDLNGADNVRIDGRASDYYIDIDMTIKNENTAGASTIRMYNGATNNTIQYLQLQGAGNDTNTGVVTLGSNGCSNISINKNLISGISATVRPANLIASVGGTSLNTTVNIQNNEFFRFLRPDMAANAIKIGTNSTDFSITHNSFYEPDGLTTTADAEHTVIRIDNSTNGSNFNITDNYIGGSAKLCSGTAWTKTGNNNTFSAIRLNATGSSINNNIYRNYIRNFNYSNSSNADWQAIYVAGGTANIGSGSGNGNTIGNSAIAENIKVNNNGNNGNVYGIRINSASEVLCQNNNISSIKTLSDSTKYAVNLYGIHKSGSGNIHLSHNLVGSETVSNSLYCSSTCTASNQILNGIHVKGTGNISVTDNIVSHLSNASNTSGTYVGRTHGIYITGGTGNNSEVLRNTVKNLSISSGNDNFDTSLSLGGIVLAGIGTQRTVSDNTVFNLTQNSTGATIAAAIFFEGSTTVKNYVERNFIYNITASGGSAHAGGIGHNRGTTVYAHNIVYLNNSGSARMIGFADYGNSGSDSELYFNTIHIAGSSTAQSFAFFAYTLGNNKILKNNIFSNTRANGGHFAFYSQVDAALKLTSDYNNYYVAGTDGVLAGAGSTTYTLSTFRTKTGGDTNSISQQPRFTSVNPVATTDFRISASKLPGVAIAGMTTDFGGNARMTNPNMGAWEFNGNNMWKGSNSSTNFGTASNWTNGIVPGAGDNVTFDPAPLNHCLLDAARTVNDISNAQSAYRFNLNGKALTLNGSLNFTNSATLDASDINSKIIFNGNTIQTLPSGALYDNNARQLEVRNNSGVRIAGTVNITGSITATSGTFDALFHNPTLNFTGTTTQSVSNNVFSSNSIRNMGIGNAAGVNIDGDIIVTNNLVVQASAKLIIPAGKSLKVNNSVTNHNGAEGIRIKSSAGQANGTFIFNGTAPQATVEFYSKASINASGEKKWQYFGVPVTSITALPTFEGAYVRKWNETGDYNSKTNPIWTALTNSSELLPVHGYEISQKVPVTYQLPGTLFNGNISFPLTYTPAGTYRGNHIISNPYTAAINIKNLATIGTNIESTVYLYNTGSFSEWGGGNGGSGSVKESAGGYTSIPVNQSGYAGLATSIPSMQGFMVKVNAASTLNIPYSSVIKNEQPQRAKQEQDSKVYSCISLVGKDTIDRAWIFTEVHCSEGFDDGWDGTKLADHNATQIFVAEKHGNMQVSSRNKLHGSYISVVATAGEALSLKFTQHDPQKIYSRIFVSDLITGKTTDISEDNSTYNFTATGNDSRRFLISTVESSLPDNETGNIEVISDNKNVIVLNRTAHNCYISIYDTAGRLINRCMAAGLTTVSVKAPFSTGVYIVNAVSVSESIQKSIIVR